MADFDINRLPAKPTERVIKAKEMFLEENPEMCCQRAIIYTEVYRNLSGRCPTILLSKGFVQDIGRTPNLHSAPGGHRWTLSFSSTLCGGISGSEYQFYG